MTRDAPRLANAPCSWGTIENTEGERIGYSRMLDELAAAGYRGTELGDWGFMPTDPERLRHELARRDLELVGSWVTVRLYDPDDPDAHHRAGVERAERVARLLREVGGPEAVVNIGDDHSTVPQRHALAGRIAPEHGLDDAGWRVLLRGAHAVAEAVVAATGLRCALHHHGSSWVETPAEIDRFLADSDPELLGLCFDTGHYALGGGDPVEGVRRYAERLHLVHLKDFAPPVLARGEREGWDYRQLVGAGVFPELGTGAVDFRGVLDALAEVHYRGWLVVEQDVLPGMGSPAASAERNRRFLESLGP